MNKRFVVPVAVISGLISFSAYAAPGEYWEITNKMEMPGMPFSMPATTTKVCIPKGGEKDPGKTSGDKSCQMTDVKTSGNKVTWKVRCDHDGQVMTGTGEQTTTANSYDGKMQMTSSGKHEMNMTMVFSGKRVGGSCDSEEQVKKMKAQICDTSRYRSTADWISGADMILQPQAACADQRNQLCDMVRKDAPRNAQTYTALLQREHMQGTVSVVKECKLDMDATTKAICKTLNADNYRDLSAHCPAEAKKYREVQRRKECEGRSYTAETRDADIKKCLSGKSDEPDDSASGDSSTSSSKKSGSNTATDVLEGAKKLKGMFGF
jgi:hypothetical protein